MPFIPLTGPSAPSTTKTTSAPISNTVSGVLFPSKATDTPAMAGLKAVGNLPGSALRFGKSVADILFNPIQTGQGIIKTAAGGVEKLIPGKQASEDYFDAFTTALKDRYGSLDALQKTATEDPFSFGVDVASIFAGGAALAGRGTEVANLASKTAQLVTKPVSKVASTVGNTASRVSKFGVSQATGLNPETIKTIANAPTEFARSKMAGVTREGIGGEVYEAISKRIDDLSETGAGYDAIRDSGASVRLQSADKLAQEARKYKSAEEFVNSRIDEQTGVKTNDIRETVLRQVRSDRPEIINNDGTITLYHGTPNGKAIKDSGNFKSGTYFAADERLAKDQYGNKPGFTVEKVVVDPANLDYNGNGIFVARKNIPLEITESPKQLTDIWNKATSGNQFPKIINDVLDKYKIKVGADGKVITSPESIPLTVADRGALEDFLSVYGGQTELSGNAFLNTRSAISQLSKYDAAKTGNLQKVARDLRSAYDEAGKSQIDGLVQLDSKYSTEKQILDQIRKDYLTKDGTFKDGAVNKIANLTGKGKEQVLDRLEEIVPGIGDRIKVLKAVEDIQAATGQKVGTYARGTLAAVGAGTGNIPAIIAAIVASPTVAVPLIRAYGLKGAQVGEVMLRLKNYADKGKLPTLVAPVVDRASGR